MPCSTACAEGYYCPAGSTASVLQCGNASVFCPAGSGSPLAVGDGYYTSGGSDIFTRTNRLMCPSPTENSGLASYCPGDGLVHVCPSGVYGDTSGLSTSLCSGSCDPGYYCVSGSSSSRAAACGAVNLYVYFQWRIATLWCRVLCGIVLTV